MGKKGKKEKAGKPKKLIPKDVGKRLNALVLRPVCRKDNLPENGNKCRLCPRLPDGWLPSPHLPDGAKKDTKSAIMSRRICVAVIFAKIPRSTYCCPAPPRDDANTSSHLIPSRAVRASCHISLCSH
jgi:hypothetical protein